MSTSGEAATRSMSSERSSASTWLSTVALTVAVRGRSASRAISPKKSPSDKRATSCGTSTATSPQATTKRVSPGSPLRNRVSPAASGMSCTRCTAMRKRSGVSTEKNGVFGNTKRAMVLRPAPLCGLVGAASTPAKPSSMGMRMAVPPLAGAICADWLAPGMSAANRTRDRGGGGGATGARTPAARLRGRRNRRRRPETRSAAAWWSASAWPKPRWPPAGGEPSPASPSSGPAAPPWRVPKTMGRPARHTGTRASLACGCAWDRYRG